MDFNNLLLEKKDGVAKIVLNRPETRNPLDQVMANELWQALDDIKADHAIRVAIVTGNGDAFCAGGDLKEMEIARRDTKVLTEQTLNDSGLFKYMDRFEKPIIAAVNGHTLAGGLELMLSCDIVIAAEEARIGDQHVNVCIVPGFGSIPRLIRVLGLNKAKEMLFTGDWITGREAERIGLVNRAVPRDKLEETVDELAGRIAAKSPMALRTMKNLVVRAMDLDFESAIEYGIYPSIYSFATEDCEEALASFREKRKPVVKGK